MSRHRTRVTLEAGNSFSLKGLKIQQNPALGVTFTYNNGLRINAQLYVRDAHGQLSITYGGQTQSFDLAGQPRRLGGVQWYMRCATTGRSVSVLWRPPGSPIFASRYAWPRRVAYASQFADKADLSWKAKRRVARLLGSTDPDDYGIPDKPKWMRWKTYDRLVERWENADNRLNDMLSGAFARFTAKHGF